MTQTINSDNHILSIEKWSKGYLPFVDSMDVYVVIEIQEHGLERVSALANKTSWPRPPNCHGDTALSSFHVYAIWKTESNIYTTSDHRNLI